MTADHQGPLEPSGTPWEHLGISGIIWDGFVLVIVNQFRRSFLGGTSTFIFFYYLLLLFILYDICITLREICLGLSGEISKLYVY